MKRCPECEFIYEEDQRFCDMDGTELAYDLRPLPFDENASMRPAAPLTKLQWRTFAVVAILGVALAAVLFAVYHTFWHRTSPQNNNQSSAKVTKGLQSAPNLVPAPPAATATPSPSSLPPTKVQAARSAAPIVKPAPAHSRSRAPKREEKKPKPESAKKESKVGSILKKTGRLLKRPFKL